MGYRLEISKIEYTSDCGGKLFGYISEEELHQCKSWQWLKDNLYIDEETEDYWGYGFEHQAPMSHDEYVEFLKLYIEDYNKYSPFRDTHHMTMDEFEESLSADKVLVEWW